MVYSMKRRGMMVGRPKLIKFDDRTNVIFNPSITNGKISVSDGNHFFYDGYRRDSVGYCYINISSQQQNTPSNWPAIAEFHSGDVITLKLKNVTEYCNQKNTYNGWCEVLVCDTSGSKIVGFDETSTSSSFYVIGKETVTYSEIIKSVTLDEDKYFGCLFFGEHSANAQTINIDLTCDVEIYVNGNRIM